MKITIFRNLSLAKKIGLGSVIPLILFVIVGTITVFSLRSLDEIGGWVDHTHSVVNTAKEIEAAAVDMETGMRGYLLAGKEDFLNPYTGGKEKFSQLTTALKVTVNDNPAQVTLLEEIETTITEWQSNVTESTIQLRRDIGDAKTMDDIAQLVAQKQGKVYFDKFRGQIATFIEREATLMAERNKTADTEMAQSKVNVVNLHDTSEWVNHTHEVIEQAMKIEAAAVDMETGMRGYLLAGKENFLNPYTGGKKKFAQLTTALKVTVNDNPVQVALLEEIETTIADWQSNVTESAIQLRRDIGDAKTMDDIAQLVAQKQGKVYFDKFRGQIATFIEREATLMAERNKTADTEMAQSKANVTKLHDASNWVNHTHEVIEQAMKVEGAAVDMETGMRGFLLAGKEEFLEPYNNGKAKFEVLVSGLAKTVADNPTQVALLGEIQLNIAQWRQNVTEPAIAMRRAVGTTKTLEDIESLVGEARGKQYFDKFRGQIATFVGRETTLMNKRKLEAEQIAADTTATLNSLEQNTTWVEHTHNVIQAAMTIEAKAVDMETGMRGYLLAGQQEFLAPYENGKGQFATAVAALSKTVNDNPAQVALLGEISSNINEWLSTVTQPAIDLRTEIGDAKTMNDMAALVGEARGKQYFDKFRGQIATFVGRETDLMTTRKEQAQKTSSNTMLTVVGGIFITILLASLLAVVITRAITIPLGDLRNNVKYIEEQGDLTRRIHVDSTDEVGQLGNFVNSFFKKLENTLGKIGFNVKKLSDSSEQLDTVSLTMASNAEQTSEQAIAVSAASEQVTLNVQTAASGAEEMSASIKEIARNASEASAVADKAVDMAERTNTVIGKLGVSSTEIGEVVNLITTIAEQTNMLALNATIEAARAGEAGKGFAVVASEVKELAKETAKATETISVKIRTIQSDTESSVTAIQEISEIIGQINTIQNTIATAVEEQSVTTNEIVKNVHEAAKGSEDITRNITGVASAAEETNKAVANTRSLAKDLTVMAENLDKQLKQFKFDTSQTDDSRAENGNGHSGRNVSALVETSEANNNAEPEPSNYHNHENGNGHSSRNVSVLVDTKGLQNNKLSDLFNR